MWLPQWMPKGQECLHAGPEARLIQVSSALDDLLGQAAAGGDLQRQAVAALPLRDVPGRLQLRFACARPTSAVSAVGTQAAVPGLHSVVLRHAIRCADAFLFFPDGVTLC